MVTFLSHLVQHGTDYERFEEIEGQILSIMAEYGGEYLFRLKHHDGSGESHLVTFPSDADFERFRADPRRLQLREEMGQHQTSIKLTRCTVL
ncbi:hypothetical protein [Pseudooceanicola sp. HF7]|uniref:hypothetical protein n=1 Tax=Pseudooceanicola sp. HF7 TaxID=2721560 RepID=UPI001431E471|nr:hypothetical protein [Pseudooceanicola sp. HF7]NIZ10527.1 hypothetical protein [Pseudooceanicola sp. HF7]